MAIFAGSFRFFISFRRQAAPSFICGSAQAHAHGAFGQFFAKAALEEFGDQLALQLIAFVQECDTER
ncbi:MAG: hypothetical protein ACJAW4_003370, partial [Paracoccaceae bacterium]